MEKKEDKVPDKSKDSPIQEINILKEWIAKQEHLPQHYDDKWLENFVKGCKFSIEKCKKVLNNFYTLRTLLPEIFFTGDATTKEIRQISQVTYSIKLPNQTPEGNTIVMYGFLDNDVSKYDVPIVLAREMLLCNFHIYTGSNFRFVSITDVRGFNMEHLSKMAPHLGKLVYSLQDAMPFGYKQIHYVYASPILKRILSVVKPLLKPKFRERVYVHTDDLTTLYKFVPQELLPTEYGGKAGTIRQLNEDYQIELENFKDVLIEEYKKKTDESKRIKDCSTYNSDLFGIDGSFKSLNVD